MRLPILAAMLLAATPALGAEASVGVAARIAAPARIETVTTRPGLIRLVVRNLDGAVVSSLGRAVRVRADGVVETRPGAPIRIDYQ